ncbi:MAG: hypothetical protein K9L68_10935 [Spirochaetales bacterium]|nr:hypothetical protein [Spirochaetales bacterium]MCF7939100.1 hypothetical protein [Spirochaetales bacterium]
MKRLWKMAAVLFIIGAFVLGMASCGSKEAEELKKASDELEKAIEDLEEGAKQLEEEFGN